MHYNLGIQYISLLEIGTSEWYFLKFPAQRLELLCDNFLNFRLRGWNFCVHAVHVKLLMWTILNLRMNAWSMRGCWVVRIDHHKAVSKRIWINPIIVCIRIRSNLNPKIKKSFGYSLLYIYTVVSRIFLNFLSNTLYSDNQKTVE